MKKTSLHQAPDIQTLLMHFKAITPITHEQSEELNRISKLDVTHYSEADVRAEVIDPVLRILGYQKETYFSLQRERALKILDKDMFIDYSMTLWSEEFWVIEAKKVKRKSLKFISSELQQAINYATHPEINAALVVLCDGRIFEIYDREESIIEPVARVEVSQLAEQFHILQAFLSPWQSWFFQKRRILRLMDKVLDHEINPSRLEEFKATIERSLDQKRGKVIENWRSVHPISKDQSQRKASLRSMSIQDLVEAEFFFDKNMSDAIEIPKILIKKSNPGGFDVMHQIFPDEPRNMNDNYVAIALRTLIEFEENKINVNWLPEWLGAGKGASGVENAIRRLISLGLSTFDSDKKRKIVLQYSATARRVAKITMALTPDLVKFGQQSHELLRHTVEEISQAQYMSSPEGHNLGFLNGIQTMFTSRLITDSRDDRRRFSVAQAETSLEDMWERERTLLRDGTAYWKGLAGRGIDGEVNLTEHNWVDYDSLGHTVLCLLKHVPEKWSKYVLEMHVADLHRIARCGSWRAREMLDLSIDHEMPQIPDEEMAQRFFNGKLTLFQEIRNAYWNRGRISN